MCECELCRNLAFDDEEEDYECVAEFDEDEIAKMWQEGSRSHCPNWKSNENEYQTVKYQAIGHLAIEGSHPVASASASGKEEDATKKKKILADSIAKKVAAKMGS